MVRLNATGNLFTRVLAGVLTAGLLVLGVMMSVVVFAALAVIGTIVVGVLWWKSRAVRRLLRTDQSSEYAPRQPVRHTPIIEGEARVIHEGPR